MVFFILFYEATKWKNFELDRLTVISAFIVVSTGLLFTSYYIPDIIEMQLGGEVVTKSEQFINTHKGSEINFKIFSLSLLSLLILNLKKALR